MSSPSEFLVFYRRMPSALTRARVLPRPFYAMRTITTTAVARKAGSGESDLGPDRKHLLDKDNKLDVQSRASNQGLEDKAKGTGSSAHKEKDETNAAGRAKSEHPEAPDAIGFQDERGGKGH